MEPEKSSSNIEKQDVLDTVKKLITFSRVRILETTETSYKVEFEGEKYSIIKDEKSYFVSGGFAGRNIGMRTELRQELVPLNSIFQDENAPDNFKEVMIFHEIKEKEYSDIGLEDAHNRAVHDEILYVLKHFDTETQQAYFKWAKEYRENAVLEEKIKCFMCDHTNESLKKDKKIVLAAVKRYGYALQYADESLKKDREFVLAAVRHNCHALEYANKSLKKNREFILEIVRINGRALYWAIETLKKDREIALAAIGQNYIAIRYVDESLRRNPKFISEAIAVNPEVSSKYFGIEKIGIKK